MKTIFTLLLATTFATSAFAYDEGKLTVTFAAKNNVQVMIDGRTYSQQENTIVLTGVQPGNHSIRIYKAQKGGNRYGRNNRAQRSELLYATNVWVRPNYHVDIMVNRFGKALIDESLLRNNDRWQDDEWYGDGSYNGYDNRYNRAMSESEFNQFVQQIRGQ